MSFVVYEKGSAPAPTVPSATIQKRGLISINLAAAEMLKNGSDRELAGVELLWDSERRIIGIRPAPLDGPNTYPLRPQGSKGTTKGPFLVAGSLFTKFIGLDTTEARRYTPAMEGDVLCIDLNGPSAKVTGTRGSKAEEANTE